MSHSNKEFLAAFPARLAVTCSRRAAGHQGATVWRSRGRAFGLTSALCQAAKIRWQEQGVAVGCEPLLSKSSLQKTNLLLIMQFCLQCLCEQGVRYKLERDKLINLGSLWCLDSLFSLITGSRAASTWSGCYSSNCCGERQSSQDWCVKGS